VLDIEVNGLDKGTKVTCAIRPERIQLMPEGESPVGKLKEIVYFGAMVRYHIITGSVNTPQELIVEVPISKAEFRLGNNVSIGLQRDYIRIFL